MPTLTRRADIWPFTNTQKGQKRTIFKKFPTLRDAMKWILQKGAKRTSPTSVSSESSSDTEDGEQLVEAVTTRIAGLDIAQEAPSITDTASTSLPSACEMGGVGLGIESKVTAGPQSSTDTQGTTRPAVTETRQNVAAHDIGAGEEPEVPGEYRLYLLYFFLSPMSTLVPQVSLSSATCAA